MGTVTGMEKRLMMHFIIRRFIMAGIGLWVLWCTPVCAQMTGSHNYSDETGDDSGIYGIGITEDQYNSYNHTYQVSATMRSPNGRTASYSTGFVSPPALANVSLSIDTSDLGDYYTDSTHDQFCPAAQSQTYLGSTTSSATGISILQANYYRYDEHYEGADLWGDFQKCFAPGNPPICLTYHIPCSRFGGLCPPYAAVGSIVVSTPIATICFPAIVNSAGGC